MPRFVIKAGEIIVEQGEIRQPVLGKTLYVAPEYDRGVERELSEWFDKHYTIGFRNYAVDESYLSAADQVRCGK